jgi:putative spermidine/putrescine transport system ATP-binding protein
VLLGLALDGAPPSLKSVSVLLHESHFLARPFELGQQVLLSWEEAHARLLGPGAQRPAAQPPQPIRTKRDELAAMAG